MENNSLTKMALEKKYSGMIDNIRMVRDAELRMKIDAKKANLTSSLKADSN